MTHFLVSRKVFLYITRITNAMRENPARPPQGLEQRLDYRVLGLIVGLGISLQLSFLYGWAVSITDGFDSTSLINMVAPLIASIFAYLVAKRYWGSEVFGKAYLALGIAYAMIFIGELVWSYYTIVLQEDPYPSIADIFFFAFYPFAIYHLARNILYFKRRLEISTKIWLGVIPIMIVSIYSYLAFQSGGFTFDFYYGFVFVAGASITFSFAILGARVFRKSILGTVWLLLVVGIAINTAGDVWYYYLEIFGQYDETHVVNSMWIVGYSVVAYALYKHRKTI
jgi:hypothetical protein